MPSNLKSNFSLPKDWKPRVRTAVLHAMALAHSAITNARGWCVNSRIVRTRLASELERARTEIAQLREEIRIKDARMALIETHKRPHYPPVERMSVLELRAARGWSVNKTAEAFLVVPATLSEWMRRVEEKGPEALVQMPEPVNKYPEFTSYLVRRLKLLCPTLGKAKIAQHLARAGLHVAVTTIGRMLKRVPEKPTSETTELIVDDSARSDRVVTAKRPNHVWHANLTIVPITSGFWVPWIPYALPQRWPFAGGCLSSSTITPGEC